MKRFFDKTIATGVTDKYAKSSFINFMITVDFSKFEAVAGDTLRITTIPAFTWIHNVVGMTRKKSTVNPWTSKMGTDDDDNLFWVGASQDLNNVNFGLAGVSGVFLVPTDLVFTTVTDPTIGIVDFYVLGWNTATKGAKRLLET